MCLQTSVALWVQIVVQFYLCLIFCISMEVCSFISCVCVLKQTLPLQMHLLLVQQYTLAMLDYSCIIFPRLFYKQYTLTKRCCLMVWQKLVT